MPTDRGARVRAIAHRSRPRPGRPRMRTDLEERLEGLEGEKAACYAEAEELTAELHEAAEALRRRAEDL